MRNSFKQNNDLHLYEGLALIAFAINWKVTLAAILILGVLTAMINKEEPKK